MERKIKHFLQEWNTTFKEQLREKAEALHITQDPCAMQLFQFVYDYEPITLPPNLLSKKRPADVKAQQKKKRKQCGESSTMEAKKMLSAVNKQGILYFVDDANMVYNMEDVMMNKANPVVEGVLSDRN